MIDCDLHHINFYDELCAFSRRACIYSQASFPYNSPRFGADRHKRESGVNPELARSGKEERTRHGVTQALPSKERGWEAVV